MLLKLWVVWHRSDFPTVPVPIEQNPMHETRFLDGFEKLHKYIREHGHSIIRKIEDLSYFTLYDLLKKYNFRAEAV